MALTPSQALYGEVYTTEGMPISEMSEPCDPKAFNVAGAD
jgi:hypothetical protein